MDEVVFFCIDHLYKLPPGVVWRWAKNDTPCACDFCEKKADWIAIKVHAEDIHRV